VKLEPQFEVFRSTYEAGAPQLVWTRLIDDLETPVSAYLKIGHGRPYAFLFESVEGGAWRGRYSIITLNPDLVWRCRGDQAEIAEGAEAIAAGVFQPQSGGALESLKDLVAASRIALPAGLPPPSAGVFGAIGYDMIRLVERLPNVNPDLLGLPDGVMTRPSIVAIFDAIAQEIILVTPVRPDQGEGSAQEAFAAARARIETVLSDLRQPTPQLKGDGQPEPDGFATPISRDAYKAIVERAKEYIRAGDIFQVVPSHRFRSPFRRDPFALYRSLRPIAGTRPRGATPEEDLALEKELLADPKERAEHLMLLDLGRNDVGRVAMLKDNGSNAPTGEPGRRRPPRVRVTDSFFIERYSHVMHLVSNVEGDAPEDLDPVDVVMAALPAGTLSGAPKVRAMEIIDELEIEKRGIGYAGGVGYFGADGSVDTCIVLRTALVKDGTMYVQAGGGVVADSDPDAEYDETLHKSRALRRAAEESWRFE
jgi:anthranilate synthase component 1